MRPTSRTMIGSFAMVFMLAAASGHAADPSRTTIKSESFDRDPGWEGHNNRVVPAEVPTVTQDFGFSVTNHAGKAKGEIPNTTTFAVDLPDGFRKQGTTFDHFGLMNMMKAGGQMMIHFDDLRYDGRSEDFASDPKWDASRNRLKYKATDVGGAHNFGFSNTAHAGGKAGEIGGTFWRSGKYAYYADKVGPLSFDERLEARGKVVLQVGAPDADMFLGWFNSKDKETEPTKAGNFLGVHVGGPTRVGHYFQPAFTTARGTNVLATTGPVLAPGKAYDWSLLYDPNAENGLGPFA
jgi:hypothetical protein